ncbi:class I SAM-dependent RNA methyltransferase [Allostreptomyces psammosilenae]|uniref:class I SAM-dependent RNA methyltransferase n=1 Tax=Allostreptomyces psammosilenae TaxID=1892865 RepID=UPI0015CD7870|nr:class I SAM-dependent RNA methyltransferase [Allostreptomyces psammosilenae]
MVGRRYEVEVGPVAHGGHCVARHEGRVLFVRHALPGERVVAAVTEGTDTSRFLRADAVEILDASPDRVPAPCPFSGPGRCGGCDWQHASVAAQLRLKEDVLAEQLHRLAGLDLRVPVEPVPLDLPEGSEAPGEGLGWRTRVRFAVDDSGRAGLRRHRSHDIEPVEHCPIAHPEINELGVPGHPWAGMETVEAVTATGSTDRAVVITPRPGRMLPLVRLDAPTSIVRVDDHGGVHRVHGRPFVRERAAGRTWRVTGSGFWQVHPAAADTLVAAVLDGLDPRPGETAIDLYCGVGLFAGALLDRLGPTGAVLGIESGQQAVEDARHNLRDHTNVRIERGRVERVLPRTGITGTDLVVLDPPRTGAGRDVVRAVTELEPRRVAYVACDPAALARDLGYFARHGYRLAALRAFDLFPMTHHLECVAILEAAPAGRNG